MDDLESNRVYEFPCERWFAEDEDDGALFRDLLCQAGGPGAPPPGEKPMHASLTMHISLLDCKFIYFCFQSDIDKESFQHNVLT